MANLLQANGSEGEASRFQPIYTPRFMYGLQTNRNPLRGPGGVIYDTYYKIGTTDSLLGGVNTELSTRLTLCRRPGNTAGLSGLISSANLPDVPDAFFSFHEENGTVRLFADTPSSIYLLAATGNHIPIFTKTTTGQTFFEGVAEALYFGDGVDTQKWLDFGAGNPGNSFSAITAVSITSNVATITSVNNFAVGQLVVISNTTVASGAFNGTFSITAVNPAFFQYALVHANVATTSDTGSANATWNLGIAAPPTAPTLNIVASGAAAIQWVANTVFSTMGLIVDPNGNVEQMISVNATGTNATQLGTTSNGEPAWNQTPGGTTSDNTITWTNWGPIPAWMAHTVYDNAGSGGTLANPSQIYDPSSNTVQINGAPGLAQGTSGATKPNFLAIQGANQHDPHNQDSPPAVKWFSMFPPPSRWQANHAYLNFLAPNNNANACIIEPSNLPEGTNQTVYLQISGGGTSGASGTAPAFATTVGQRTSDGDIIWLNLGTATRANLTAYTAWSGTNPVFSVIKVSTTLYVCTVSGTSASSAPTFTTAYGDKITDGSVVWTCVGPSLAWAASTQWYLPASGFQPPSGAQPYGGAEVLGSGFVQAVIASGKSGGSTPSWSTTIGADTTDNAATWRNIAAFSQNSIAWTKGYGYAYSYKARTVVDQFSPIPLGGGLVPPGLVVGPFASQVPAVGLGTPTGSADGTVSTASPTVQMAVGPNTGAVVYVSGIGSTDPQVDTIVIWRTDDGGATYFELTEILNPNPIGGIAQPWTFQDFLPDNATANFPGLFTLILAPLNHFSDPPLAGAINFIQHLGRLWYSVGAVVYASDGPLVGGSSQPPGNGFTQFNPAQFWEFNSPVVRMVSSSAGLLVFTTSDVGVIYGGPAITQIFQDISIPQLGLSSYNALAQEKGLIYLVSSDKCCFMLDPNQGLNQTGQPIGDIITKLNPAAVYLTFLSEGSNDRALFLGDGSTGWYRCNPNQSPDSAISGPVWSPKATIAAGAKAIAAVPVAQGQNALLIGGTSANQPILVRDSTYTTFSDNGAAYPANYIFGSIVLANPGQVAEVVFITCEFMKIGTSPRLAVLLDEISDTVLAISQAAISGTNTTYTYTLTSGPAPFIGMQLTITGMADAGNNGTFTITGLGAGTFTVVNANGVNHVVQTGAGTRFEDISGYISSTTGLPPQDPTSSYGLTLSPSSIYANRYYLLQSINGAIPTGSYCRHMQIRVDYGSTDTVQNEILSQTIYGAHHSID